MSWLLNIFGSFEGILTALGALFLGGYAAKAKYDAIKAESKLKNIEKQIAKTNVVIAKTKAKAKAQGIKAETDIHIETLKELKKESKKVQKEMEDIEKDIQKKVMSKQDKKVTRNRKDKISIDI